MNRGFMQKALVVILLSLHPSGGRDPETQDQSAGIVCNFSTCWETKGLRTTLKNPKTNNKQNQKAKKQFKTKAPKNPKTVKKLPNP